MARKSSNGSGSKTATTAKGGTTTRTSPPQPAIPSLALSEVQWILYQLKRAREMLTTPNPVVEHLVNYLLEAPTADEKPSPLSVDQEAAWSVYIQCPAGARRALKAGLAALDVRDSGARARVRQQLSDTRLLILRLGPDAPPSAALSTVELRTVSESLSFAQLIQSLRQLELGVQLLRKSTTSTDIEALIGQLAHAGEIQEETERICSLMRALAPLIARINAASAPA